MAQKASADGGTEREQTRTSAGQFANLDDQTQADLKHDAWSAVAEQVATERPELHDLLDSHDAWDDMELEVYEDEHGRAYFHKVTGVTYAPGHENGKRLSEAAHEFLNSYRATLTSLVEKATADGGEENSHTVLDLTTKAPADGRVDVGITENLTPGDSPGAPDDQHLGTLSTELLDELRERDAFVDPTTVILSDLPESVRERVWSDFEDRE